MRFFDGVRRAFRPPAERPEDIEREIDDELSFHIAMREERLRARGVAPDIAASEARRRFGNVDIIRSECAETDLATLRDEQIGAQLGDVGRDIRIATRSLRRAPGFTIAAIALLALGIGGTTSVFSIINAIYLRPLPYPAADRLATIGVALADPACDRRCVRAPTSDEVAQWSRARTLEQIGMIEPRQGVVEVPSASLVLEGAAVSNTVPALLGLHAVIGRGLLPEDFAPAASGALVLSHSAWQTQFGGDTAVVGQLANIDAQLYRIVGVLAVESELGPPLFSLNVRTAEYLVPRLGSSSGSIGQVVARLRTGRDVRVVQSELDALLRGGGTTSGHAMVQSVHTVLSARYRASFGVLLAAVVIVLLIACMNVTGLMLARLNDKMPELATRAVLGAGRLQLVQQVVTETLLIALTGGAAGLLLGYYGTNAARLIPPDRLPFWTPVVMDTRVVALALALALASGLLLSIAPMLVLSPARIMTSLREIVTAAPTRARLRGIIVSVEIALCVVLLAAAGILTKQLIAAELRELGSAKKSVIYVSLLGRQAPNGTAASWAERIDAGLRSVPGVASVGVIGAPARTRRAPPTGTDAAARRPGGAPQPPAVFVDGRTEPVSGLTFRQPRVVGAAYFDAIGTALVAGRAFNDADNTTAPPVAIINAASARRIFPSGRAGDAIGKRIRIDAAGSSSDWITIVGVAVDARDPWSAEPPQRSELYRPLKQVDGTPSSIIVRVHGDTHRMIPLVRGAIHAIDPRSPIANVLAIEDGVAQRMWTARFNTDVLAAFAGFALVLACLGVYATVSYVVARRRRELAIRVAVGATRHDVILSVVRSALGMIVVGLAGGVAGSLATSRVLRSLLSGSDGLDIPVLVGTLIAIVIAGGAAAYLPARRAASADPATVLRAD